MSGVYVSVWVGRDLIKRSEVVVVMWVVFP
jgi:hypothetical protein